MPTIIWWLRFNIEYLSSFQICIFIYWLLTIKSLKKEATIINKIFAFGYDCRIYSNIADYVTDAESENSSWKIQNPNSISLVINLYTFPLK